MPICQVLERSFSGFCFILPSFLFSYYLTLHRDSLVIALLDTITVILCGAVVFAGVGCISYQTGVPLTDVITTGNHKPRIFTPFKWFNLTDGANDFIYLHDVFHCLQYFYLEWQLPLWRDWLCVHYIFRFPLCCKVYSKAIPRII